MKKEPAIGILFAAVTALPAWCAAQDQALRFLDVPPSAVSSTALRNVPLSPEARAGLEKALEAIVAGKKPAVIETKPFGCPLPEPRVSPKRG